MSSFFYIAQKQLGVPHYVEPNNTFEYWNCYFGKRQSDFILSRSTFFIFQLMNNIHTNTQFLSNNMNMTTNKYYGLFDLLEKKWITDEIKDSIITLFGNIQKTYGGFSKLAQLYRHKKATIINSNDLGMNPISETNKNVIKIFQNNSFFLFNISELINIFNNSLGNTESFFVNPLMAKNPYNNVSFKTNILYYIYFKIKESSYVMPLLFHYYFLSNFNQPVFSERYEFFIRENAIKNMAFKSTSNDLVEYIYDMLDDNAYTRNLQIDENFPDSKLIEIMRPYVYMYLKYYYSLISKEKTNKILTNLFLKLKLFYEYNPAFGRKIIKRTKEYDITKHKFVKRTVVSFNDTYLNFHDI